MMHVQVEGVEKVYQNLNRYASEMFVKIDSDIIFIGEAAKRALQNSFPDLDIQSDFRQETHSYFLLINVTGQTLKWIYCPKWNRYFSREQGQTVGQEFRKLPKLAEEINKTLERISRELIARVNTSIKYLK